MNASQRWMLVVGVAWSMAASIPVDAADEFSKKSEPFHYDSRGRRDPFSPLVRDGRLVGSLPGMRLGGDKPVLYGILWDPGGKSIALINDGEVKVGDTIGGYEVAEIRQDAVVLTNGGEPMVLHLIFETPSDLSPDTTTGGEGR